MGTSRTRRSVVCALALLVAALGAACEDEEPSDPPTSAAPSTSDTTSPTEPTTTPTGPVEPTLPAAAEVESKAGAEAFVDYYYDVINYATATGDLDDLRALADPSCTGCASGLELIERVYNRGGRIDGGGYRLLGMQTTPLADGFWSVRATTRVGDQVVRGAGPLNKRYPGGRGGLLFTLRFRDDNWTTTSLEGL